MRQPAAGVLTPGMEADTRGRPEVCGFVVGAGWFGCSNRFEEDWDSGVRKTGSE